MTAADARVVLLTAPSEEVAVHIARTLVEERLLACANLVPGARSIYRWQGALCDEREVLLIGKTIAGRVDALLARVPELHPYQTPELLVLGVGAGLPGYLAWLGESASNAALAASASAVAWRPPDSSNSK